MSWNTLKGFASLPGKELWKCTHNQSFLCLRRYDKLLFFQLLKLTHVYRSGAIFFWGCCHCVLLCKFNSLIWCNDAQFFKCLPVSSALFSKRLKQNWPQLFTLLYRADHHEIHIFINSSKGCALAEPGGPWRLTFASGRLETMIFHTDHMLGSLDYTGSEHWAPFNFP